MMRVLVWLLLVIGTRSLQAQGAPRAAHPVVLISIDGLKPEYVLEADRHGLAIPHLRALRARGSYATGVTGVVPTVTYPSHTTLVTGAAPARHGIVSNNTFDPYNRNQGGWYWYASDIRVPTLWDAVAQAGRTTGNVHWPVTVGARITWNLPQYWRTGERDDRKLVRALSTPGLYDAMEREVGVPYADGIDETIEGDERRARFAARLMESRKPALMLAYFTALDHEQHGKGPFSPAAFAILERIDAIVGTMVAAAKRAYGERAVVAVVSDHGFMPTSKSLNLIHAFRSAGLVDYPEGVNDKPSAWRATLWSGGGSAAVMLADSSNAAVRARVDSLLRSLAKDSANGIDRVLDAAALRERGGFPGAAHLVSMREGYGIGGNSRGPLVATVSAGGAHGYLPDAPQMRASFFIAGPGIPAGRDLGVIDQRAIAPTLASWLGVRLRGAELGGVKPVSLESRVR
jgi:predicted AlkP superfamily pyrophosphatase or phosphodiesterase